ncbi:hypothetical protein ABFS82_03G029100 [Erythranthe guttata]|uniref:Jacalin-type lectin domain-containing protein n=1 Tax=Erythranthe guttata TaxID=4155 RepID=A0A022R1R8_ERYGU|nr:hypothetical protein MIMGU_mgv1a025615mg [Erythranthe guttata]
MENQDSCEGEIFVGPWGCSEGNNKWGDYKPKGGIKTIIISYGDVINSIRFVEHGSNEASPIFGDDVGRKIATINIECPSEYLTGMSGCQSLYPFDYTGRWVIDSLSFQTNVRKHGPIGPGSNFSFSFPMNGGKIVGFHLRAGNYLNAIGVYVKPFCRASSCALNPIDDPVEIQEQIDAIKDAFPRDPGPWGGISSGKKWDDGVFSAVKQIQLHVYERANAMNSIQFEYVTRDRRRVWMPRHGFNRGGIVKKIDIDECKNEYLIGVAGFYGPVDGINNGLDVIRSITFYSNKGKYGPFGDENGTYFSSISSRGKVVGFHGSSGSYLNSLGVHVEYF